jgi:hypothetical protein
MDRIVAWRAVLGACAQLKGDQAAARKEKK